MQKIIICLVLVLALSCQKEKGMVLPPVDKPHPVMSYTELGDTKVALGNPAKYIDVDGDGVYDFAFSAYLTGDPILQRDRIFFSAYSDIHSFLYVDASNQSPALARGDSIYMDNHQPYEWYNVSEIYLTQKVIEMTGDPYWEGNWKDVSHRFLPTQVLRDGKRYVGWVELSVDKNTSSLVLHRAAICTEAGKNIKAGF